MLKSTLPEGDGKAKKTAQLSETVMSNTSPPGCNTIRHDMDVLRQELNLLHTTVSEVTDTLETSLLGLDEFETEHAQLTNWLTSVEDKVKVTSSRPLGHAPEVQVEEVEVLIIIKIVPVFFSFLIKNIPILPQALQGPVLLHDNRWKYPWDIIKANVNMRMFGNMKSLLI